MCAPLFGAYITGPLFKKLKILSVFEYFKLRYDSDLIQFVAVFSYLIRNFLAISIFMYGPAISLSSMVNIHDWLAISLIGIIATLYTAIGGLKGVIWTDVFQTAIMFIGLILVIIKGVIDANGLNNVWEINKKGGRLNFFIFDLNPFIRQSNWSNIFGSFIFFSISYGVDQQMIQRFMASKSKRKAQHAILLNIPGIFFLMSLCAFVGLVMFANFSTCDPLSIPTVSHVTNPNQLVSYFIKAKLGMIPGMIGLFLAAILSAGLSTISSLLNSQTMIIWNSIFKRFHYFRLLNDNQSLNINKFLIIIIGTLCTLFSFVISRIGNNIFQVSLGLLGAFGTPIISLFALSYFFKRTNSVGAFVGTVCGFIFVLWISIGSYLVKPIYPKLETSLIGCNFTNLTNEYLNQRKALNFTLLNDSGESINVFGFNKIYTISFAAVPLLGFFITIITGLFASLLSANESNKKL